MASHDNWREILTTNIINLSKNIVTKDGLEGELKRIGALPERTIKRIWKLSPSILTFELIADFKKRSFDDFKKFCEALEHAGQAHIVRDYLTHVAQLPDPVIVVEDHFKKIDLNNPRYKVLSEDKKGCLRQHLNELCDEIVSDKLFFNELQTGDSLTHTMLSGLEEVKDDFKRNGMLINYISVGSEKRWADFCQALIATNQESLVASYLNPSVPVNTKDVPAISNGSPISERSSDVVSLVTREKFEKQPPEMDVKFDIVTEKTFKDVQKNVECENAYPINGNLRGLAVIINNFDFTKSKIKLSQRYGAEIDAKNLLSLFGQLNFHCRLHVDKTKEGIEEVLEEARTWKHHKQSDCFVLFILTHGFEGGVYGTDGETLLIKDIWKSFSAKKCPDLIQKPKLFFFQACQGGQETTGYATDGSEDLENIKFGVSGITDDLKVKLNLIGDGMETDAVVVKMVHELADMFIAHSVVNGYASYRHKINGSVFVRCLVDVLSREAHERDLHSMMIEVIRNLHDLCIPTIGGQMIQLAKIEHTLRRMNIYLLPEGNHHHYKSLEQNKVCNG